MFLNIVESCEILLNPFDLWGSPFGYTLLNPVESVLTSVAHFSL